ncbi:MAG: thioredoxin family protein [Muribaculaceae bacterium]|nr:thioredoxin family protein [Muribaculaceae bacterium]MBQ5409966.1 thioredoxin family protein [Muribaculaceae bacterium]MBQ5508220.1 thioredoxin family protein [Muribaculaceae bacterium]
MKKILAIAILAIIALGANAQLPKVYNDSIDPMEQIDNALDQAKANGKFVICQVGGNWCPWCLKFAKFITDDEEIAKVVNENFVYIHVSYNPHKSTDKDRDGAMLQRLGSPSRFGYPVFVVLNHEGKVLHIQDSSFLEEGKGYNKEKVLRFFNNWTPKAVNAQ